MDSIEKILENLLIELEIGEVTEGILTHCVKLNTNHIDPYGNVPFLKISDKEELIKNIKLYLKNLNDLYDDEHALINRYSIKSAIMMLFANMSIDDFNNPINYIKRRTNFISNPMIQENSFYIESLESNLDINVEYYRYETPYCFRATLSSNEETYELPIISYGISEDVCYIYAIQDKNRNKNSKYAKKIKRKLYKINNNVYKNETDEYKEYKNNKSDYYPENISDVSPSFVFTATLFLKEIENLGIKKVKIVPYLPLRYNSLVAQCVKQIVRKYKNGIIDKQKLSKYFNLLKEEINNTQDNITNKFIRTFRRIEYHFGSVKITSLPMELDDCLNITLDKFENSDNEILNELISKKSLSK